MSNIFYFAVVNFNSILFIMKTYSIGDILLFISEIPFHSDSFFGTEVIYSEGLVESTCGSYVEYITSKESALQLIADYVKDCGKTWEG